MQNGFLKKNLYVLLIICTFTFCDTKKKRTEGLDIQFLCYTLAICNPDRGVKFGMLGDSWTDLVYGVNAIENLRVQLEKYHDYKIVGSTLGGQEIATVYDKGLHIKVIDEAGPSIKYMLVSLGGNDVQNNPEKYIGKLEQEKQNRFDLVKTKLLGLIQTGNAYKVQKWGGAPLLWIIHGYDYPNPDNATLGDTTSCRGTLKAAGFTDIDVNTLLVKGLDDYNLMLQTLTTQEPQLRYIDLRRTLGGPPFSNSANMFDCIHPNSIGFNLIGNRYAQLLAGFTNNEK